MAKKLVSIAITKEQATAVLALIAQIHQVLGDLPVFKPGERKAVSVTVDPRILFLDPLLNPDAPDLRVYRRRGKNWQKPIDVPGGVYETPRLLPGFRLVVDPDQ